MRHGTKDGYGDGDDDGNGDGCGDGDGYVDGDRCHVTFEGQPRLHRSENRATLATPVLLTTKLLHPGVKQTLFQSRMNLVYYLDYLNF